MKITTDSPSLYCVHRVAKANVFYSVSQIKVYRVFIPCETTVAGASYLDMLQMWLFPQLPVDSRDIVFTQGKLKFSRSSIPEQ